MHIFFSGIGGAGIGPLALIAKQAGYDVSGSDNKSSSYIEYLKSHGIEDIHIGQTKDTIEAAHRTKPIDWFVYSSALSRENPSHPELQFVESAGIKHSKRDEFLNRLLEDKHLKLIAIAGTHGKTTTTAMVIWLMKRLGLHVSYSVGAKLSFGEMGEFNPASEYFVYECDEFDRNFLAFRPYLSIISGIDWDHPDIYPTREEYYQAFRDFVAQSAQTILWQDDISSLNLSTDQKLINCDKFATEIKSIKLKGDVNRQDAYLAAKAVAKIADKPLNELLDSIGNWPGISRRFEELAPGLYTDYAHTPAKIRGALQLAHEVNPNVVVVYEGLHNTRQHFIMDDLKHLFDEVSKLYVVPSYLAREDQNLDLLRPENLITLMNKPEMAEPAALNDELKSKIKEHLTRQELVLCLSAGGGGSLDEWLRQEWDIDK